MPIRKEFKLFYGAAWRIVRARILERAGHCCEQCGKPNHERVETHTGRSISILNHPGLPVMFWRAVSCSWRDQWGSPVLPSRTFGWKTRTITVVLTVAHLNHVAGDDRDENLKALCQWCHLNYDQSHHRETRSKRKDSKRALLAGVA